MLQTPRKRGFTFVEVIVVIGIVTILLSIIMASIGQAREKSRDRTRVADLAQLEFALAAYTHANGSRIDCQAGLKIDGSMEVESLNGDCADGQSILAFIETFLGSLPADPLGPGNDDYYYYFDNNHNCLFRNGVESSDGWIGRPLLFAVNLEASDTNVLSVCDAQSGNDGGFERTTSYGGTKNPSVPYVVSINFSEQ